MEHEYTFNGQREGEKVMHMVKNHPFVLFWPGIKGLFFIVMAVASVTLLDANQYSGIVALILALIGISLFARSYYVFAQSVFLITSQRVINVEQNGFWKRKITETEIEKIQDASSSVSGLLRMMIKFGDLVIRTAGASKGEEIVVRNIANPYEVQQAIARLIRK